VRLAFAAFYCLAALGQAVACLPTFHGTINNLWKKKKVYFSVDKIIYYDINKLKIVNVVYAWLVHL
jgi:hypothetical protein